MRPWHAGMLASALLMAPVAGGPALAQDGDRSVTIVLSVEPSTLEPCEATSDAIGA